MKDNGKRKPRFVCGIDFGTTFTSVAFAFSTTPDDVKLVQHWPSISNSSEEFVPTEVHYTNPPSRDHEWGYLIRKDSRNPAEPLQWFKLLLARYSQSDVTPNNLSRMADEDDTLSSSFDELTVDSSASPIEAMERTAAKLKDLDLKPVDVIADFLSDIREVTLQTMARTYDEDFVAHTEVEYVLTIPAIWSDQAKHAMIQAAEIAGLGTHRINFHLISEPEAAAVYTMRAIQPHELRVGQSFVVCDAGGGTCDLVSYEITQLMPLKVNEAVGGTGDYCGSVFLDKAFNRYIKRILGSPAVNEMRLRPREQMKKSFIDAKEAFCNPNVSYEINVGPSVADNDEIGIYDGYYSMPGTDLQEIFDPRVNDIIKLIRQQIRELWLKDKPIAAIILVGGFGTSEYLRDRLAEIFHVGMGIQVIQPVNARTAIARGALMRGIDGSMVYQKRSRRFYGNILSHRLSHAEAEGDNDTDGHTYWHQWRVAFYVDDRINWFLARDEIVGDTFSATCALSRCMSVARVESGDASFIFTEKLIACDEFDAPKYKWRNRKKVYEVCRLTFDLSDVPLSIFKRSENCFGEEFYEIRYTLKLSLAGDVLTFGVLVGDECMGEVSAQFEM